MKNLTRVTKTMGVALLMIAIVGCDAFDGFGGGDASGSAVAVTPLFGSWTIGLANTDTFTASAADSSDEPRNIASSLGNIVEILGLTFDEVAGTVTIVSTECETSRTFDLEQCDGSCSLPPDVSDEGIHVIIDGDWGPIPSCDSVGSESGSLFADLHIFPEVGKLTGYFNSSVTTTTIGDVTINLGGSVIGARSGLPVSPPDPYLVNGTWTADLYGGGIFNTGDSVSTGPIDFYVTAQFDRNGGVNIILEGDEETCFPSLDFNYAFHVEMDDFGDNYFQKEGSGCIVGSFDIENICDTGANLRGVVIADIDTEGCDYYEMDGTFELMLVGSDGDNPPDFSAYFTGSIEDGMRDRPDEANESTLVGDWYIYFDDEENDESYSDILWFNLNEMLHEFSDDPSTCSNLVSFPYVFNGETEDPQYTVTGGWNLMNTCEGDQTDSGTQTLHINYDAGSDNISGSFFFSGSGTDSDGQPWSESGSGTFTGYRVDCND